ncbi:chitobiosyldiphosphodolichol beta-mannosyltransferase-like protein [Fimicolochytrium jonesii]|uniref:chitobiosyldiphosphodolichol beta-mannosyltransferase-like protein n=1 Tax=Fimicolochytrium jonesii TaxID=1396493 RepID=UPI0022FEE50B|nr:chitobiosyldiphosphodolichol beta-mannosyltransferase-like protein [Fimicolochytrium jonesii]KAI8817068.1 chitobiosyldiphosphodolichol beta-mannosyltransferase-like protein [Fimicolochytrium jonesii]
MTAAAALGTLLTLMFPVLLVLWLRAKDAAGKTTRVLVLVLGDIGRSPRTQYHAISLAREGFEVHLAGYQGSPVLPEVLQAGDKITVHHIPNPMKLPVVRAGGVVGIAAYVGLAAFRVVRQLVQLLMLCLRDVPAFGTILVQNPPAVPTLVIVQFLRLVVGCKVIIDWHNFGYSIMALNVGQRSRIVKLAEWYEKAFGNFASAHLCVSKAMAAEMKTVWGVRGPIVTMYDKPPSHFRRLPLAEIHAFLSRYDLTTPIMRPTTSPTTTSQTLLTHLTPTGTLEPLTGRPALVVSSTSWTEDEDFEMLLEGLGLYEAAAGSKQGGGDDQTVLPDIVLVITGKGPLKDMYLAKIKAKALKRVRVLTAWLPAEDYPLLLGSADLGISLHTSSSGLDLPMKIVDMFGCGLPVCAVGYPCLEELVQDGVNGRVFGTPEELCGQLKSLLATPSTSSTKTTPHIPTPALTSLRAGTKAFGRTRWHEEWVGVVEPLIVG